MTRTVRTRLATAAVLAPLALGLVACGDSDDDAAPASDSAAQTQTDDGDDTTDDPTDDGTDDTTGSDAGTTIQGDVETAAETALGEVDGTVFSVDGDAQGWDVTIVTADGVETDVDLSADATSVTRTTEETGNDADDDAERERLLGVSTDYLAAIEAASAEVQGTVTGVDLGEENGTATWEVAFDEDTADETTVEVDAESGEVVRTEQGD